MDSSSRASDRRPSAPSRYDAVYAREQKRRFLYVVDDAVPHDPIMSELRRHGFVTRSDIDDVSAMLAALPSTATVVDIGCGLGAFTRFLSTLTHASIVGLDVSGIALETAASRSGKAVPSVALTRADFHCLPFRSRSVAAVVAIDSLYQSTTPARAMAEVARVLVPEGMLFLTTFEPGRGDASRWVSLVVGAGLSVVSIRDLTEEWRSFATDKHERRLRNRTRLVREMGEYAEDELGVSEAMIGTGSVDGVIDQLRRFTLLARVAHQQNES